ncbi:MAG: SynChlorMet cassette radical SAM/SPASM protein ScmE [Chlorobiaceae bacterium]|nr:SynChlorMet cassette radical SAM/SPASM protein ScmE [Chlorobiaceae bacterium]
MKSPKTVELSITNRCNLRCIYCAHFTSDGDQGSDLSTAEWLKFFVELNRSAVLDVTISGGEPFMRDDLRELIDGIVRNRMRFSILSNGTLITDEMAAYLASTGRCDYVQVSIDGSYSGPHDAFRNNGSFDLVVAGLKHLQAHHLRVNVRVTIHRHNVQNLDAIARFLLEDLNLPGFSTNAASYAGLCRSYADEVQLTVDDRSQAMETLLRLNKQYNGRISASAGPLAEAKHWLEMEDARTENRAKLPNCGSLRSCGGVFSGMAVRADGIMLPCSQMPHIELGRINQDHLVDVWLTHPEFKRLRERRAILLEDFDFCRQCDYIPYCRGNCPALAYNILGEENHPSPDACLKRFLEAGGRLPTNNGQLIIDN